MNVDDLIRPHELGDQDRAAKCCKPLAKAPEVGHIEPVAQCAHRAKMITTHDSTQKRAQQARCDKNLRDAGRVDHFNALAERLR